MSHTDLVADWLRELGLRIRPTGIGPEELVGSIAVLTEDLAELYGPSVFCRETILLVARRHKFWPNLAELCEILGPWWRERREANRVLALPPPGAKSAAPYDPGSAPEWCFERNPRHMGRVERGDLKIPPPLRTVEEQLAILQAEPQLTR